MEQSFKENFNRFRKYILDCLLEKDIKYFMDEFSDLLDNSQVKSINLSDRNKRVANFIEAFDAIKEPSKYSRLSEAAKEHNRWIYNFLNVNLIEIEESDNIVFRWILLDNTLQLIKNLKESFVMDETFIHHLFQKEIISKSNKDFLIRSLNNEGEETALYELFDVISMKDPNWYGHLLYIIGQQNSNFINIFIDDISDFDPLDQEKRYLNYAEKFIDKHLKSSKQENSDAESMNDDIASDYGSLTDEELFDLEISVEPLEDKCQELVLKNFQLELAETAISGKNVIIYAPTGSGKTNVAVYIANDHLKKNPNGKIAFLVHRIPLVTQQFKVFKKYGSPTCNIIDIRGKSDKITGPLIAHLNNNNIIIMTSDILRNALTLDDGNKIRSISEFSLIFIDECHNCMKGHPYTRIMQEYFKEKRLNPSAKLPQIVGLTASPRSNKKDDIPGIKKSLYELCANLDCFDISMTKINKTELEEFVAQPKQTTKVTGRRRIDEFERLLLKQMENCESKLMKMKSEKYFPSLAVREIPTDKYRQDYVGFVGNLERLNTVTCDENDGKQKAFTIYRYLNAFYRGLIVNQMFDQKYAKLSIKKYLNHSGTDFSCSFDEEFYKYYEDEILSMDQEQTRNPVIEEIISYINRQFSKNQESRILVFVREIDFTCYLVDILKSSYEIPAEAIVGSNAKTDLKVCSDNDIDHILTRFHSGTTKVLVATTVVEEGLDVALCNMVISYGHVTNETAMIQRRGRVRAVDSEYILILPPMLHWLERKELINEHRKALMMKFISQFENIDRDEMVKSIRELQYFFLHSKEKKPSKTIQTNAWNFSCKNCQTSICTSDYIRIIEHAHRICIIPDLLAKFTVVKEERQAFGSQGFYEYGGKVLCIKCQNFVLGNYIYYRKIPYFQLHIKSCNIKNKEEVKSLKKWDDFGKYYELKNLSQDEQMNYFQNLKDLGLLNENVGDAV